MAATLRPLVGLTDPAGTERAVSFRTMFNGSPIGMILGDAQGKVVEVNPAYERMVGYSGAELAVLDLAEITHPADLVMTRAFFRDLRSGKRASVQFEKRYYRKDGELIWCQLTASLERHTDGRPAFSIAMVENITERKLAELALRETTERLARIVQTQHEIAAADLDLSSAMCLIADRSLELTGAVGIQVTLLRGTGELARAVAGVAVGDDFDLRVPFFEAGNVVGSIDAVGPAGEGGPSEDDRQTFELLAVMLSSAVSGAAKLDAQQAQVEALGRLRTVFEGASIGIARVDKDGYALEANPALERMLGYSAAELAVTRFREITHPDDVERSLAHADELMAGERDWYQLEKRYLRKDGELIWVQITAALQRDEEGAPLHGLSMIENITERKIAEEALRRQAALNEHQALHDALTGLPNRTLFQDRIQQALLAAKREGGHAAVLTMDLDRFKEVNDALGHEAGDVLLKEVAQRLSGMLRASDTVARLGGDEFGILLPRQSHPTEVVCAIEKIRQVLEEPILVQGLPLAVEASIGVSFFPSGGEDASALLQHADAAMYAAKQAGSEYAFYDEVTDTYDPARLTLVSELRGAMDRRELVLHYQPEAMFGSGKVSSVEALLRWNHPERGSVSPDDFIPLAQETGLIKVLTLYVVDEALRQCREWQDEGLELRVAVNLSTRNLLDLDFPEQVMELLEKWHVEPTMLEFEITESTMLADPLRAKLVLDRLSAIGIKLAIDDFGTGYSSLAYLTRLPVSKLKIDRSFVSNMRASEHDAVIVRSTIDLGRNLGLEVVAEGVEDTETWDLLERLGCSIAQGYYLTAPLPASKLRDWLSEEAAATSGAHHWRHPSLPEPEEGGRRRRFARGVRS
jgi:diguanylate cyclase (GGDEF)-like protein/PAS domain S-box-containing protein